MQNKSARFRVVSILFRSAVILSQVLGDCFPFNAYSAKPFTYLLTLCAFCKNNRTKLLKLHLSINYGTENIMNEKIQEALIDDRCLDFNNFFLFWGKVVRCVLTEMRH